MVRQTHRVNVREGYALWASSYDSEKNPLIATEEPRVQALLDRLPVPARVLDVATGTGRWALWWARRGVDVVAIDQSPEMLAVARRKADADELTVQWIEGTIEDGLPFSPGEFDLVCCALALSHLPEIEGAILECARVVRRGGYLLITDFHPQAIANGWMPTIVVGEDAYELPAPGHTLDEYLDALASAGMELIHRVEVTVREQDRETILVPEHHKDAFIEQFGDWAFCLILLAQKVSG